MAAQRQIHPYNQAAALLGATQPRYGEVRIRSRGRLPHWEKDSGLYFVTFHLADSLPLPVLKKLAERHRILEAAKTSGARLLPEQEAALAEYSPRRMEEYFDRGFGSCALKDQRIAGAVAAALRFRNGKHYRLLAWCIMPNHVHVVVRLLPGADLARVLKSWKQFSSKAANRVLGQNGRFWHREYYDRGLAQILRCLTYPLKCMSPCMAETFRRLQTALFARVLPRYSLPAGLSFVIKAHLRQRKCPLAQIVP